MSKILHPGLQLRSYLGNDYCSSLFFKPKSSFSDPFTPRSRPTTPRHKIVHPSSVPPENVNNIDVPQTKTNSYYRPPISEYTAAYSPPKEQYHSSTPSSQVTTPSRSRSTPHSTRSIHSYTSEVRSHYTMDDRDSIIQTPKSRSRESHQLYAIVFTYHFIFYSLIYIFFLSLFICISLVQTTRNRRYHCMIRS